LGGFGYVSSTDLNGSSAFLQSLRDLSYGRVLDCGAGIGRISKGLLCPLFQSVDLVEQCAPYVEEAKKILKNRININDQLDESSPFYRASPISESVDSADTNTTTSISVKKNMGHFYVAGLQDFQFQPTRKYDLIWVQWVNIIHLLL
jgi:protein N-terminal methyltransferase